MGKQWQGMDLQGGGLQQVQLAYKQMERNTLGAYLRWLLFPLGWHRFYLREPIGGLAFPLVTAAAAVTHYLAGWPWLWLAPAVGALADLAWIPGKVVRLNKDLRMATMMSGMQRGAPRGFKGHFTEENTTEPSHPRDGDGA
jgi:TM2 domain-containing membrane protein YozV